MADTSFDGREARTTVSERDDNSVDNNTEIVETGEEQVNQYEPFQVDIETTSKRILRDRRPVSGKGPRKSAHDYLITEDMAEYVEYTDKNSYDKGEDNTKKNIGQEIQKTFDIMLLPSTKERIAQEVNKAHKRLEQLNQLAKLRKPVIRFEPKIAEALVTCDKLEELGDDVLDFLAEYCIIKEERLGVYEEVFCSVIDDHQHSELYAIDNIDTQYVTPSNQISQSRQPSERRSQDSNLERQYSNLGHVTSEFATDPNILRRGSVDSSYREQAIIDGYDLGRTPISGHRDEIRSPLTPLPPPSRKRGTIQTQQQPLLTAEEFERCKDLSVLSRVPGLNNSSVSAGREYLGRLDSSVDLMLRREEQLKNNKDLLQAQRFCHVVDQALIQYSDNLSKSHVHRYSELLKIQDKQRQASAADEDVDSDSEPAIPLRDPPTISKKDEGVYKLLDQNMMDELCDESLVVHSLDLQLTRVDEKLAGVESRLEQILGERAIVRMYCEASEKDEVETDKGSSKRPGSRVSSSIFDKQHSDVDRRLPIDELFSALSQINRNLITENELYYINHLLDLPGRRPVNFHLFSVIAALSEKIVNSEKFVRDMIDNMDCEALLSKIETCKKLFLVINNGEYIPESNVSSYSLGLDLLAGGVEHKNVSQVVRKLTRNTPGMIDFLDFVTYIPLFIGVHRHIIADPLTGTTFSL